MSLLLVVANLRLQLLQLLKRGTVDFVLQILCLLLFEATKIRLYLHYVYVCSRKKGALRSDENLQLQLLNCGSDRPDGSSRLCR